VSLSQSGGDSDYPDGNKTYYYITRYYRPADSLSRRRWRHRSGVLRRRICTGRSRPHPGGGGLDLRAV